MKLSVLLLLPFSLFTESIAQSPRQVSRYMVPVAAHYRQLAVINATARSEQKWMDTIRFPIAKASAASQAALKLPTNYVQSFNSELRLPTPPANSSARTRAELDYLLRVQQYRKPEEIEEAKVLAEVYYIPMLTDTTHPHYRANIPSLFYVGSPTGNWFNAQNLPTLTKLLQRVHQDASHTYYSLKYQYNRPRPYQLESRLQPMEQATSPSYPSSHGAAAYVNAYLFSELEPQLAPLYLTKAFQVTHSREILGVDYPSDGEGARIWARRFVNYLLGNPTFQKDWKVARAEWKQVRKVHPITY
ncbi:phosphatase PAP2 family protein [Fibrisoma montanum]|uniref:Phosphatase PAP2 family protein n=1 Tax=Fibrisoma montanum TaxID=2305895 RepID=A0A418M5K8_9BACT|nr:phosphatase PAP2 family protein [Fibrisoma montanum]RIV21144.1 phosphatase PAP2 family protein [Fibrisoma montanum]